MIIDIIFIIVLVAAILKGLQRGLIIAVFSILALMAGLAAAIKLSAVVASHFRDTVNISNKWMPVLAFILVFILVVLLVRWVANLIEKAIDFALIGWIDKLAGAILYAVIYITVFSVLLFYAARMHWVESSTLADSKVYPYIQPWGPKMMDMIARVIPAFKDVFRELEEFFDHLSHKIGN